MGPTVCLVRNARSAWCEQGKLLGRRDVGLSAEGRAQAEAVAESLSELSVDEVISSPLSRAIDTAQAFATRAGIEVARDPRLIDVDAGKWEGHELSQLWQHDAFRAFVHGEEEEFPGGEAMSNVAQRVIASVEQALFDNPDAGTIVMVSHATPIRIALAHYLGLPVRHYQRLRVSHAAVSVLRFEQDVGRTRVLAVNCAAPLARVVAAVRGA